MPGSRIRALRYDRYTYAVYFGDAGAPFEYELYDNQADPLQLNNLVNPATPAISGIWKDLHARLVAKMHETNSSPMGFPFPTTPM